MILNVGFLDALLQYCIQKLQDYHIHINEYSPKTKIIWINVKEKHIYS